LGLPFLVRFLATQKMNGSKYKKAYIPNQEIGNESLGLPFLVRFLAMQKMNENKYN
jgi:hypothetical protein